MPPADTPTTMMVVAPTFFPFSTSDATCHLPIFTTVGARTSNYWQVGELGPIPTRVLQPEKNDLTMPCIAVGNQHRYEFGFVANNPYTNVRAPTNANPPKSNLYPGVSDFLSKAALCVAHRSSG
jgi:hypothetical protein